MALKKYIYIYSFNPIRGTWLRWAYDKVLSVKSDLTDKADKNFVISVNGFRRIDVVIIGRVHMTITLL